MKKVLLPLLLLTALGCMLFAAESAPSSIVGYVKYPCVTTVGGLNMVALPMESGYVNASDLGTANPDLISSIAFWEAASQSWVQADNFGEWVGDFPVTNGEPLLINATADFNFYSMGTMPATIPSYDFIAGLNMMMVPLNKSDLTTGGAVSDAIGVISSVAYWEGSSQSWVQADNFGEWVGDFPVTIGLPLLMNATDVATWPGAPAKSARNLKAARASK